MSQGVQVFEGDGVDHAVVEAERWRKVEDQRRLLERYGKVKIIPGLYGTLHFPRPKP